MRNKMKKFQAFVMYNPITVGAAIALMAGLTYVAAGSWEVGLAAYCGLSAAALAIR